MRLNVILFTIVLGGLISGAVFFIFGYPVHVPTPHLAVGPPSGGQEAFLLPVSESNYSPVRDFNVPEPEINAEAAILLDVASNKLLYVKNINKRLPIASLTKLMTAIVVVENLDLDEVYIVPAESVNVDGLGADLYRGEKIKGRDLLKIMLIKSSNDAAIAFVMAAQKRGIDLVGNMNQKARDVGMHDTRFSDAAGLNDDESFSTASDLVKLVRQAADYELISETSRMPSAEIIALTSRIYRITNTNQLLRRIPDIIIGKTGYTDKALGTMALEVGLGGDNRVISIVLGSDDRFGETIKLIDWAKRAYKWE